MTPEAFRKHGREVIDWIAHYLATIESRSVLSQVSPGEIRAKLPPRAPERGEPFEAMLRDVDEIIMPGITHWQSPNFFGFFPANASEPAILGELLSAGLGVQGMLWMTSPACTELEMHVLDWLVDMLDLPEKFKSTSAGGGVIQDTASSATLCALIAARERATNLESNRTGARQPLVAYASTEAHSSVEKAVRIAGIGSDHLRLIDVDDQFAMRPDLLRSQIERDRAAGMVPFFVCATVGTTASSAIDPVGQIGEAIRTDRMSVPPGMSVPPVWLHVDAAMSGVAALCPELRFIHDELEYADSYCFNAHKWMLTNFDCDCFWVTDRAALIRALSILPEYLRNQATESGAVIDYRDWQIPLGRRFRALKLWFVIRHYGVQGLQHHVREHVAAAHEFARWVENDPDFELAVRPVLNLVCFRHRAGDAINEQLMNELNRSGSLYLTHAKLNHKFTLRISIGGTKTERKHVDRAWNMIRETGQRLSHAQLSQRSKE